MALHKATLVSISTTDSNMAYMDGYMLFPESLYDLSVALDEKLLVVIFMTEILSPFSTTLAVPSIVVAMRKSVIPLLMRMLLRGWRRRLWLLLF